MSVNALILSANPTTENYIVFSVIAAVILVFCVLGTYAQMDAHLTMTPRGWKVLGFLGALLAIRALWVFT